MKNKSNKINYALGGTLLSMLPTVVDMASKLFANRDSGINGQPTTNPYGNTQFSDGGFSDKQFIYSEKLGYADELRNSLKNLMLPKGTVVQYSGDKHSDASGGIDINNKGEVLGNGKANNKDFENGGIPTAQVEDKEVTIDFNRLSKTDTITQNTVKKLAEHIAKKNMAHKMLVEVENNSTKLGNGDFLGNDPTKMTEGMLVHQAAFGDVKPIDIANINANALFTNKGNNINITPPGMTKPVVPSSGEDFGRTGGTGEALAFAGQAVPTLYNLAKGIFDKPAPSRENEFNNSILQRAYRQSADNTAQRNQANLAMNAGRQNIENNATGGTRLAALAGLNASNIMAKQQMSMQNAIANNQIADNINQTEAVVGQDRMQKFLREEANKQAKSNQIGMGIQQVGQIATNFGNNKTQAAENSVALQALNQISDFEALPEELKKGFLKLVFRG